MGGLQKFEQRLEQLISGVFARAFRSAVQPVEIAAALQRECDNNAQILSRDRRLVPNDFHVELAQTDLDRLAPYDSAMAKELTDQLQDHADAQSYVFPGPVKIAFEAADDLTTGRFRIRSQAQAKVTGHSTHTQVGRARALLDVNGTSTRCSHRDWWSGVAPRPTCASTTRASAASTSSSWSLSVGSNTEDPEIEVHDMGSTNGMLVNGRRCRGRRCETAPRSRSAPPR